MRNTLIAFTAALLLVGCGSSSSSTSSTSTNTSSSAPQPASTSSAETSTRASTATQSTERTAGSSAESGATTESSPGASITDYGAAAASAEKTAISVAAFSFFKAMAASDYAKLCDSLSISNQKELQAFDKVKHRKLACSVLLKGLISTRGAPEAREAAAGKLISVRVKDTTAFVIFKPKGGVPSYFVLKREAGAWKAISLAPGAPLDPTAPTP